MDIEMYKLLVSLRDPSLAFAYLMHVGIDLTDSDLQGEGMGKLAHQLIADHIKEYEEVVPQELREILLDILEGKTALDADAIDIIDYLVNPLTDNQKRVIKSGLVYDVLSLAEHHKRSMDRLEQLDDSSTLGPVGIKVLKIFSNENVPSEELTNILKAVFNTNVDVDSVQVVSLEDIISKSGNKITTIH